MKVMASMWPLSSASKGTSDQVSPTTAGDASGSGLAMATGCVGVTSVVGSVSQACSR